MIPIRVEDRGKEPGAGMQPLVDHGIEALTGGSSNAACNKQPLHSVSLVTWRLLRTDAVCGDLSRCFTLKMLPAHRTPCRCFRQFRRKRADREQATCLRHKMVVG